MSYRRKNGPMNDMRRFDRPAALIGSALTGRPIKDMMPFGSSETEEILELFGGKIAKRR